MSWALTGLAVVAAGAIAVLAVFGRRRWLEAEREEPREEPLVGSRRGC
jgi:hypothetical protein